MGTRILGARVIDPASGLDRVCDLYLDGGKIAAFDQAPADFDADQEIDARGLVASPGLVDLSVALREPGYSRKGTIASETLAAAAGGVPSLCCPPLTKPVLDTSAVAELILDRAQEAGHTKVFPIGALTKGLGGEQLAELVALRDAGCVAFANGLAPMANNRTLRRALEYA
ncbi:MAG TPA: dihydroorotase, partial [Pseudomonas sp.]|nr:dihydroorotase [Pseudomonas sp.]